MNNFTFNQLRYFYKLAQTLNYRIAAEQLFISQPSLSRQIQVLEKALGVALFKKQGRNIVLTNAGQEFVIHAGQILRAIHNATQSLEKFTGNAKPEIKVGFAEDHFFYPLMNEPGLDNLKMQELMNDEIITKINSRELDAGVTFLPVEDSSITSQYIFSDNVVAVVAKNSPLSSLVEISMTEIAKLKIATLSNKFYFRKLLNRYFQNHLIFPNYQFELSSFGSCIDIVQQNNAAIALIPKSVLAAKHYPNVVPLKINSRILKIRIGLVYLKESQLTPTLQEMLTVMVKQFGNNREKS
ncbi:LysR family transcriptional regulator [Lactobacillus sp. Sy-1]|uniref:LysR family transcriptional regulator n=1 Tax=Lactobacillus sp. Sy-1 TaxID=2109645 RepID=UPI001C5B5673|nr:LysR family transcriptional regulator [Lactobacillus sp. Sy-1]MBW1606352.1 LysR family transcriptional regulator [Lactobacillus sp. Sy-1]